MKNLPSLVKRLSMNRVEIFSSEVFVIDSWEGSKQKMFNLVDFSIMLYRGMTLGYGSGMFRNRDFSTMIDSIAIICSLGD